MAHIDHPAKAIDALRMASSVGKLTLYGGSNRSYDAVAVIEGLLSCHPEIKVEGRDLLRGPWDRSVDIALDTETGKLFKPSNICEIYASANFKKLLRKFDAGNQADLLRYDGGKEFEDIAARMRNQGNLT